MAKATVRCHPDPNLGLEDFNFQVTLTQRGRPPARIDIPVDARGKRTTPGRAEHLEVYKLHTNGGVSSVAHYDATGQFKDVE